MTKTNNLHAALDAADQRVHVANEALRKAVEDKVMATRALEAARVPDDAKAHLERLRQAGEVTLDEKAERSAAEVAYEAAQAAEGPLSTVLSRLVAGIDPLDGSPLRTRGERDHAREEQMRNARREAELELGSLRAATGTARRELNAVVKRTDAARHARRLAEKSEWTAELEARRRRSKPRTLGTFDFVRKLLA